MAKTLKHAVCTFTSKKISNVSPSKASKKNHKKLTFMQHLKAENNFTVLPIHFEIIQKMFINLLPVVELGNFSGELTVYSLQFIKVTTYEMFL